MTINRSRSRSPVALGIILAVVLGIAVWVLMNSAFFAIREVRVDGARSLLEEDVARLAQVEVGENLIMLPTEEVAGRLERDPWILDATVERDLPNTVVISVVERRPAGWIEDPDGFALVSGDRTVLTRAAARPERLPEVGSWPETLDPGDTIDALGTSLRVSSSMAPSLLRQVATVRANGADLTMEMRGGGTVLYGEPTDIGSKNSALSSMLRWAQQQGIAVLTMDVRVPSAPSLKPVRGEEVSPPIS